MRPNNERDHHTGEDNCVPGVPDSDIPTSPGQDTGIGIGRTRDVDEPPNKDESQPSGGAGNGPGGTEEAEDGQESVPEPPL